MNFLRRFLNEKRWLQTRRLGLLVIVIALAIMTHVPIPRSVQQIRVSDKLVHLLAYFPLGLLLPACAIRGLGRVGICLLVIAGWGILDELLQIPVGRTASVYDWLADLAGATAGCVVYQHFSTTTDLEADSD